VGWVASSFPPVHRDSPEVTNPLGPALFTNAWAFRRRQNPIYRFLGVCLEGSPPYPSDFCRGAGFSLSTPFFSWHILFLKLTEGLPLPPSYGSLRRPRDGFFFPSGKKFAGKGTLVPLFAGRTQGAGFFFCPTKNPWTFLGPFRTSPSPLVFSSPFPRLTLAPLLAGLSVIRNFPPTFSPFFLEAPAAGWFPRPYRFWTLFRRGEIFFLSLGRFFTSPPNFGVHFNRLVDSPRPTNRDHFPRSSKTRRIHGFSTIRCGPGTSSRRCGVETF